MKFASHKLFSILLFAIIILPQSIFSQNPMGKTWVVFITNSTYETFASLEGPGKDAQMMRHALQAYDVDRFVHKKDMTKAQMQTFFNTELNTLLQANKVKSVVVWFAGHGKSINQKSYWIPVDARRDDELTYFDIESLKTALKSYNKVVSHSLVITDACESGPSFYQAMRSFKTANCSDPQASRFKSSQAVSSSGYELAADNSQFTKAFAKALQVHQGSCLAIEDIVYSVRKAVQAQQQQRPKFGKIPGMGPQKGTFFFMKK